MKRSVAIGAAAVLGLLAAAGSWAQGVGPVPGLLDGLSVGDPIYYQNLTIVPLFSRRIADHTPYLTLDQALHEGLLEVREKGDGDVPWVLVSNRSPREIYIMAGEILSGCRQDRIVARDVLVSPKRRNLAVPVYCVEAGRWHSSSREFGSEKNLGTYKLRAAALGIRRAGVDDPGAGQSRVWSEVSKSNRAAGISSDTEAYQDAYRDENVARQVAEVEERLLAAPQLGDDTVGVMVALGEQFISMDAFASPHLFRELWPKNLKSSAMAMLGSREHGRFSAKRADGVLEELRSLRYAERPAVDLGRELVSEGWEGSHSVSALVRRDVVLHLAAFAALEEDGEPILLPESRSRR